MKISANEMLLINKNLKFKGDENGSASTVTTPVINESPENPINALNAQSMNNIAFQGVNLNAMSKGIKAMAAATLITAAGLGLQSCENDILEPKQPIINVTNTVNVNIEINNNMSNDELLSAVIEEQTRLFEEIEALHQDLNKQHEEQMKVNQAILEELIKQGVSLDRIIDLLENMNMTAQDILAVAKDNSAKQDEILDQLSQGNETLKAGLESILHSIKNGNKISAENNKLLTALIVKLNQNNNQNASIISLLNQVLNKIDESIKTQVEMSEATNKLLAVIIDKISSLDENMQAGFAAILDSIDTLSDGAKDALAQLLDKLDKMSAADKQYYQAMTQNMQGLRNDIRVATMLLLSRMDMLDANARANTIKIVNEIAKGNMTNAEILNAITKLMGMMDDLDGSQAGIFNDILGKLSEIDDHIKQGVIAIIGNMNADADAILNAINKVIKNQNKMSAENKAFFVRVLGKLDKLDNHLKQGVLAIISNMDVATDELLAAVDKVIENQEKMSEQNKAFFEEVLAKLDKMDANSQRGFAMLIRKMIENNHISADILNKINKVLAKLDQAHKDDVRFYNQALALLTELAAKADQLGDKADDILDAIANIGIDAPVDLSNIEKMLEALLAQSKANGDVLTTVEGNTNLAAVTLEAIKSLLEGMDGDNKAIIARLDAILKKIPEGCKCEASHQELLEQLKKIVEELQKENRHEGILDDLENEFS